MEGNKSDNRLAPAEEEEPLAGESALSQPGDPEKPEVEIVEDPEPSVAPPY